MFSDHELVLIYDVWTLELVKGDLLLCEALERFLVCDAHMVLKRVLADDANCNSIDCLVFFFMTLFGVFHLGLAAVPQALQKYILELWLLVT